MGYWVHLTNSLDKAMLHRDRCLEIPANPTGADFWQGSWVEYPDKEMALDALENSGVSKQIPCPLCKP